MHCILLAAFHAHALATCQRLLFKSYSRCTCRFIGISSSSRKQRTFVTGLQEQADSAVVLPPGAPAFAYAEHNIQASYVPPGDWAPSPEALQEAHARSQLIDQEARRPSSHSGGI